MAYIQALAKAIANQLSSVWTTSNRLPVDTGASANSVTIQDPTTSANKMAVNGSGQISVSNQPSGFATETTLAGTKTSLEAKLGDITDAPATDFNSSSGLSGLIRLLARLIYNSSALTASSTGTINQQLRFIAENSSGGTQYDNGATPATPRGTVALGRNGSNVLTPLVLDSNGFLRVAIASGATNSPTEYSEGSSVASTVGGVALGKQPDGTLLPLPLSASGLVQITAPTAIPVSIAGGGGGGTQYTDGTVNTSPTGTVILGRNPSNVLKNALLDTNNYLLVTNRNESAEFSISSTSVTTALTTLATIDAKNYSWLGFQINNTGANDFNDFQVQIRFSATGAWNPITFSDTDFTTGSGKQSGNNLILIVEHGISTGTGVIRSLPASANAWVRMHLNGVQAVRLQASVASGTTTVTGYGIVK